MRIKMTLLLLLIIGSLTGARATVSVSDATDEGQACFKVTTDLATYYYKKQGAGFISILDSGGKDWISHSSAGGAAGEYRGIPNMVDKDPTDGQGYFHPGSNNSSTVMVSSSPSKVTLRSTSNNNAWECTWDFYNTHATMTVTKNNSNYWFLYEGTPGGTFSTSGDYYLLPNGTKNSAGTNYNSDLAESKAGTGEWICFGDNASPRVLFLVHHENDSHADKYWQLSGQMTVFGFGRDGMTYSLSGQHTFTIGLMESTDHGAIKAFIESGFAGSGPESDPFFPPDKGIVTGRTLSKTSINSGEAITASFSLVNNESSDLNGLVFSENLPDAAAVATNSVRVNGTTITNYQYSTRSAGTIFSGSKTHVWIVQGVSQYGSTNKINGSGGTFDISYSVTLTGSGTIPLEGYAWLGKTGTLGGTTTNDVFGYCAPTNITVQGTSPGGCWSDDFADGNYTGWTIGDGSWSVSGGQLQNSGSGRTSIWSGDANWTDITYTADVTPTGGDVWIIFRVQNATNYYLFTLEGKSLYKLVNGNFTLVQEAGGSFGPGSTYKFKVDLAGTSIKIYEGSSLVLQATDSQFTKGKVGFGSNNAQGRFDNAAVTWAGCQTILKAPVAVATAVAPLKASPNPFKSTTAISFAPAKGQPRIRILDITGNEVRSLVNRNSISNISWDGRDHQGKRVSPGLYYVTMERDNQLKCCKVILTE